MWSKGEALKYLNSYFHHFELQNIFSDFVYLFIYFFHYVLLSMKLNNLK